MVFDFALKTCNLLRFAILDTSWEKAISYQHLLCLLVGLALILELAGLAIAAPSVDGRDHALASDAVVTGHVVAQRSKRFCDGFGGVWDITIQRGYARYQRNIHGCDGVHRHGNRAKTGRKLDMTATGLSPCQCHNWQNTVVTKIKYTQEYPYWEGTTHFGGGTRMIAKMSAVFILEY